MSRAKRRAMVERADPTLSLSQQCRLLAVSRASVYRRPPEVNEQDRTIMALIDRQYLARPYYGSRRMAAWLATQGHLVNRKRVQRLMRLMGLVAIYQRPNTSKPAPQNKVYPYLLGGLSHDPGPPQMPLKSRRPEVASGDEAGTTGAKQGEERRSGYGFGDHHPTIVVCRSATKIPICPFLGASAQGGQPLQCRVRPGLMHLS
jgi:putative transposase